MISKKMAEAINEQINKEFFSEYLYISMQGWLASQCLDGMANWMEVQSKEEHFHAMKLFNYLIGRGARVHLMAIDEPTNDFENPLQAFSKALEHEKLMSKNINELVDVAIKENDHATRSFLQWYVDEQVEEESTVERIVNMLKMVGENGNGIMMLDRELATRTYVAPADASGATGA